MRRWKCFAFFCFLSLLSIAVMIVQLRFLPFLRGFVVYSCPQLGLQPFYAVNETWTSETKCKLRRPSRLGCATAYKYYGRPGQVEDRKCEETRYPDICSFKETKTGYHTLLCNPEVCGSSDVEIGSVDIEMGKVHKWTPLSKATITATVQEAVETNQKNGFGFLYIKCGDILQSLTFPPILKKDENGTERSNINVNVIVLDSIARPHFYRILPRSVAALRKIAQDPEIKATALDFEVLQSVGPQTFDNLRPFFSGVFKDDNEISEKAKTAKEPLGIEVLYGTFKKWGYQTLFQEDLCWYDRWGIALTDIQIRESPDGDSEFKARWSEFQSRVSTKHIDNFGMLHFSCTVFKKYKMTNHFESPHKVCFNGEFYSQYFLDYITKVYSAMRNDKKAKSMLSYMHFNTGHEYTGVRMINMDANLAKFLIEMAQSPDTLTVIFSDHGNTNTAYSSTDEGRREAFDPVMFMLIPDEVAENLGKQRMAALVENQKRLLTLLDLHRALMSLNDREKMNSQSSTAAGMFAVIPANRTCADLQLVPLAKCICETLDNFNQAEENSEKHKWLAEFALGTLNDAIQTQHMGGTGEVKYGYGNCQRLVGKSFTKIMQRYQGDYIMTTMDLHVVPPAGFTEDEVFKVSLKSYAKPEDKVWLTSYTRQSRYSKFESCADKSVDIRLCVCVKEQTSENDTAQNSAVSRQMFGSETIARNLDKGCLLFLRRNHGTTSLAMEVANVCGNRTYKFTLDGRTTERLFSKTLPINVTLSPNTFYFLTSFTKHTSKITDQLHFTASIQVKNDTLVDFINLGERDVS